MSTSGQRPTLRTWQIAPLIFAGGLGISVLLFVIIWSGETRALASELDADAAMAVTSLDNTLEVALDDLKSLESFFGASELLTRAEFQGFTRRELFGAQATPGVQAFFWAPIVPATERPAYEAAAVREGLVGFRFRERLGAEGLIAAEARDEYIPIYYLEPRAGNECALGLDLASDPTLRSTLVAARSSHNVHMAEVRALCAPDDGAQQILLVRPVLKGLEGHTVDGVSAPSGTLAGYMASTLRLDELVAAALDNQRLDDLQVYLFDRTAEIPLGAYSTGSATQPAPAGPPPASARDGLSAVATMEIGGHQWELIIRPTWRYVVARRTLMPWMILTVGLSFTGLAVLYVWQRRQAEERLLVYRQIVSATRDLLAFFDRDQICRAVNDAYLSTYGKGRSETVGRHMRDLLGAAAYTERVKPIMDRVLQGEEVRFETWLALGGGAPRFVEARYIPYDDQNGTAAGVVVIVHDLTERKMVEDELRQAATVFENTLEGVMITDPDLVMVAVNRAFSEITGYSKAEAIGQTPRMLQSGRQDQAFYQQMWAAIKQQGRWQGEVWNRRKNGEIYPEWLTVSCVTNEDGQVVNYIAVFSDISHLKRSEEQLAHLAHYDALTDLPNRLLLYSRLEHALERAERHSTQVAVLFIDLDRFKNINDSLGHPAGDEVLVAIAHRLKERLRISDTIARLGGDEFVVLLEDLQGSEEAAAVAYKLIDLLGEPFTLAGGQEIYAGGSIGISIGPDDADSATRLIRNADTAMYQAKANGGATFQFYTESMTRAVNLRLELEGRLRRALERQEFVLHYQPQIDLATGRTIGVEALIRWYQPEQGLISPAQFIPVAEETGLIGPIGEWVLRSACAQVQAWRDDGHSELTLSVNLSPRQFRQLGLVRMIQAALAESGLPASQLELEITEGAVMEHPEQAIATLQVLREQGVRLAIDDFGTGYSSLSYLQRFALNKLKIDRSFIKELPNKARDASIAATIIAMAHNLGLEVLAEGVESAEQLAWLRAHRCDAAQGYLFSRPLPAEQLLDHLDTASVGQRHWTR